jgi:hypothetical protein
MYRAGAILEIRKNRTSESDTRISYFEVDLKRFRVVVVLKGERLGDKGAIALAQDLLDECCEKMEVLDLSSCKIGRLGLDALSDAFKRGTGKLVHTLILRNNELPGQSMKLFGEAVKDGALPLLRSLDLQGNYLGDNGAALLASIVFRKGLPLIEFIYLQRNDIKDQGAVALYRAFEGGRDLCPCIKGINISQNRISYKGLREMLLAKPYFNV